MTNDQIAALAREYAEECIDPQGFSKETYEELVEEKAENVAYVLRWIRDRYCLVEKSKVREAYLEARATTKEGYKAKLGGMIAVGSANKALLESLFPEIAKEVEK